MLDNQQHAQWDKDFADEWERQITPVKESYLGLILAFEQLQRAEKRAEVSKYTG